MNLMGDRCWLAPRGQQIRRMENLSQQLDNHIYGGDFRLVLALWSAL
jgi:hypothetical protein